MAKRLFYSSDASRFSARWWFQVARNAAWVVVITILIWLYADMEFAANVELHAQVKLATGGPTLVVIGNSEQDITFTISGTHRMVDEFRQRLAEAGSAIPCLLPTDRPGQGTAKTADLLNQSPMIAKTGLTVVSATPATLTFSVDQLVRKEVPVEVDYDTSRFTLAGPPTADPPKVAVTVPQEAWDNMVRQLPPGTAPTIKTERVELRSQAATQQATAALVPSVGGLAVRPDPKTVKVAAQVIEPTRTADLTVIVKQLSPPEWDEDGTWREYKLERKDPLEWRKKVQVTGPTKAVDSLPPDSVDAYVTLTDEDKRPVESWLSRKIVFRLPEGLQVKVKEGEKPTVDFRLTKQTATPP